MRLVISTCTRFAGLGSSSFRAVSIAACLSTIVASTATASALQVGILTCDVQGFDASVICDFRRDGGPPEAYSGIIEGIDLEHAASKGAGLSWMVVARSGEVQSGELAGDYGPKGTGVLVGGYNRSFALHAIPADEGESANLAAEVRKITLVASN